MEKLNKTEERILDTALSMVSEQGSFNLTIRDLAREADVNIAAINYYFETKDNMLEVLKDFYIENTRAAYSAIEDDSLEDLEKLRAYAGEIIDYTLRYPGVVSLLKEVYRDQDQDEAFKKIVEITSQFNDKFDQVLRRVCHEGDERTYQFKKNIFMSSIIYPASHMEVLELDEKTISGAYRDQYIDYLLNLLVN